MRGWRSRRAPGLRRGRISGGDTVMIAGLIRKIGINVADMQAFGPMVLSRHLKKRRANPEMKVNVRGVGSVNIRAGESDIATIRQVFLNREYDTSHPTLVSDRIEARYREILARGGTPIIADIGANIGAASLWFLREYPDAAIVAVEPEPANVAVLKRNLDGRANTTVIEAAIGATPGFVALDNAAQSWAVQTSRAERGIAIVTVDEVLARAPGDTPFIVKIDIEGFESDLFESNLDWIAKCYVVMIEPHDWMMPGRGTSFAFQRAMAQHSFELFIRGENLLSVRL